jgi:hypothetical protein
LTGLEEYVVKAAGVIGIFSSLNIAAQEEKLRPIGAIERTVMDGFRNMG